LLRVTERKGKVKGKIDFLFPIYDPSTLLRTGLRLIFFAALRMTGGDDGAAVGAIPFYL